MKAHSILELQSAAGTNAKQNILKKYADDAYFKRFLYYALNPLLTYNLSEKTLREYSEEENKTQLQFFNNIFECCEYLSRLRGIDDATVRQVKMLLYSRYSEQEREIYIKLLSKTIRLGVTAKTVNKVIPGLIPEWEVQQAFPVEKYPIPDGTKFWLTQKLNGVRATFYNGQLIARSGIPYKGLDHIIKEIAWAQGVGFVLDGELTLMNKGELSDNEAFRVATGILNSEDVNKTSICFTIFDAIPVRDFESPDPKVNYSHRRVILKEIED
jgi:DNA ligase-1